MGTALLPERMDLQSAYGGDQQETDPWGRTSDHKDFGMHPNYAGRDQLPTKLGAGGKGWSPAADQASNAAQPFIQAGQQDAYRGFTQPGQPEDTRAYGAAHLMGVQPNRSGAAQEVAAISQIPQQAVNPGLEAHIANQPGNSYYRDTQPSLNVYPSRSTPQVTAPVNPAAQIHQTMPINPQTTEQVALESAHRQANTIPYAPMADRQLAVQSHASGIPVRVLQENRNMTRLSGQAAGGALPNDQFMQGLMLANGAGAQQGIAPWQHGIGDVNVANVEAPAHLLDAGQPTAEANIRYPSLERINTETQTHEDTRNATTAGANVEAANAEAKARNQTRQDELDEKAYAAELAHYHQLVANQPLQRAMWENQWPAYEKTLSDEVRNDPVMARRAHDEWIAQQMGPKLVMPQRHQQTAQIPTNASGAAPPVAQPPQSPTASQATPESAPLDVLSKYQKQPGADQQGGGLLESAANNPWKTGLGLYGAAELGSQALQSRAAPGYVGGVGRFLNNTLPMRLGRGIGNMMTGAPTASGPSSFETGAYSAEGAKPVYSGPSAAEAGAYDAGAGPIPRQAAGTTGESAAEFAARQAAEAQREATMRGFNPAAQAVDTGVSEMPYAAEDTLGAGLRGAAGETTEGLIPKVLGGVGAGAVGRVGSAALGALAGGELGVPPNVLVDLWAKLRDQTTNAVGNQPLPSAADYQRLKERWGLKPAQIQSLLQEHQKIMASGASGPNPNIPKNPADYIEWKMQQGMNNLPTKTSSPLAQIPHFSLHF